jgi:hypothetical protein
VTSDERYSFVLTALAAAAVILVLSRTHASQAGGLPDPPRLGRPAGADLIGPGMTVEQDAATQPQSRPAAAARAEEALASRPWPAFARRVVVHPLAGDVPEGEGLEHGSPYHVVIGQDGVVRWTRRGVAGSAGVPPGIPLADALDALHVALPDAGRMGADRTAAAAAVWAAAASRFGPAAVVFADEVPGSHARVPDGFDRARIVAPAHPASRPETTASRPVPERPVTIGFGRGRIFAAVAKTTPERARGLGGRPALDEDEGLLFVYRTPDRRSFWMWNMRMSIDILYLADDGTVIGLSTLPPPNPRAMGAGIPRFESSGPCRLVLEVAAGQAERHGVKAGTRLELPASVARLLAEAEP